MAQVHPTPTYAELLPGDTLVSKHRARWRVIAVRVDGGQATVDLRIAKLGGRITIAQTKVMVDAGQYPATESSTHPAEIRPYRVDRPRRK